MKKLNLFRNVYLYIDCSNLDEGILNSVGYSIKEDDIRVFVQVLFLKLGVLIDRAEGTCPSLG